MAIQMHKIGKFIAERRNEKGLTQAELGQRLNVSFQAVSKWERGESLPDTALLLDLADILNTSADQILTGGERVIPYRGTIHVANIKEGLHCLQRFGELVGKENLLYRSAIRGINEQLNTDIEAVFQNDQLFEVFLAEAIIQNLMAGYYVDLTDVRKHFQYEKYRDIVCEYAARYGIR